MPPPNARRAALIVIFGGLLAGAPAALADDAEAPAAPTIYKWVDANGIAHYTTELSRVPRSVRGSVRALGGGDGSGESYVTRDAGSAAPPPEAAPAEPLPEWDVGDAPPPAPAPAPAPGRERWAETDRPFDMPPGEAGETPAPAPTQTAAADAPAGEPAVSAADRESLRRDLDERIAALEAEIASDENALKGFLAVPGPENPAEIAYDQSFREVAERLPKRLAELRSLQGERAQLEQP